MSENVFHKIQILVERGRRIRIREDHTAVLFVIIFFHNPELFIERLAFIRNAVQIRPHFIERICNIREKDRFLRIKKCQKTHGKYIIRSDSHKNLIFSHMIIISQCAYQEIRCRIRVKAKRLHILFQFLHRRKHSRCRRIRILIGI